MVHKLRTTKYKLYNLYILRPLYLKFLKNATSFSYPFVRLLLVFQFWSIFKNLCFCFWTLNAIIPKLETQYSNILNADCFHKNCVIFIVEFRYTWMFVWEYEYINCFIPYRNQSKVTELNAEFLFTQIQYNPLELKTNWNCFCFRDNQLAQYDVWVWSMKFSFLFPSIKW